jgi:hypothetical protein
VRAQFCQLYQQGTQQLRHRIAQLLIRAAPRHDMFHERHDFLAAKVVRKPLQRRRRKGESLERGLLLSQSAVLARVQPREREEREGGRPQTEKSFITLVHSFISATSRPSDSSFSGTDSINFSSSSWGCTNDRLDNRNVKMKFCARKRKKEKSNPSFNSKS